MVETVTKVTVSLPKEMLAEVDALAAGQKRSAFFREAIEQRLAYERWFREQVTIGIEAADQGELISTADVKIDINEVLAGVGQAGKT